MSVVTVRGLRVEYAGQLAVDGVDLEIAAGESLGLVGESGSGKSTVALALTRYLPRAATLRADEFTVAGQHVLELDKGALRRYRAQRIGVVYQEPGLALDPTSPIGAQVSEVLRLRGLDRGAASAATIAALGDVGLPEPESLARRYPHELSGGQQQRVVIAMALANRPELLILDEPTTGLDSNVEADILALIDELQRELGFASLLISHNLPLIAAHSDRVSVLEHGRVVETTTPAELLRDPQHSYSRALVAAIPDLEQGSLSTGEAREPLLEIRNVSRRYGTRLALDDVSLTIGRGEVVGLVGESGSGKSTLGRIVAGLLPHDGSVTGAASRVQVVFQNPDASLNPRRTVRRVLARSIRLLGGTGTVEQLAASVGLGPEHLERLPQELSGGQKQRVAIARAFAGPVPLVVLDEPTSALDVSVQARILDLLAELREQTGVAYLFISHDLAVVRRLADRVAVLRDGRLVEVGTAEEVFAGGRHEYTDSLLGSARMLRETVRGSALA